MPLRNTSTRYGWVSIALHWGMALAIFAMFGLGLWMRDLGYYDTWYQRAPHIHKSIGLILLALLVFRLLWRATNPTPQSPPNSPRWERLSAHLTHYGLYAMLVVMMLAGYLISTADGRAIEVFNWFSVPATVQDLPNQEDVAGEIHEILAWAIVLLAGVHALAALKHHFYNRDNTLKKMLGLANQAPDSRSK
ncbi:MULTISPECIES: cytochrome b [Spongiibacter]|uniref:cytochrome b n=1 Tax=Spongiibacter TaxID=630749 RepID=UPI000C0A984C|nr:cytochrome b [Spongiibacter sp.]MAK42524.1 cytochrome B [Spongiibacter sp.]|tara:strand:- start:206 stop:781 length:576 start_codon:yes stop_codon:yes gene_type:complete